MKNDLLRYWAQCSAITTFHVVAVSICATGLLLSSAAEDLGPIGPATIIMGIALMVLSVLMEVVLVLRLLLQFLAKKLQSVLKERDAQT